MKLLLTEFIYPSIRLSTFTVFEVSEPYDPKDIYHDWVVTGYNACAIRSERIRFKG